MILDDNLLFKEETNFFVEKIKFLGGLTQANFLAFLA